MRIAIALIVFAGCSVPLKLASDGAGGGGGGGGDAGIDDAGIDVPPGTPVLTVTGQPPALGNESAVTFTYSVSEPATVECSLDAAAFAACPPPTKMFAGLTDGAHTFDLRASANGEVGTIPTVSFSVDTMPPVVAITGEPAGASPVASGDFEFMIGDALTATCTLDSAAPQSCTTTFDYSGLGDGSHTFTLAATDAAGNTATKSYTWTVQTAPPSLAITSEPPSVSATAMGQFQFTIGSSVTVTCQIDGGAAQTCSNPYAYSGLADGSHTFTLRGTDAASNTTTKSYTWTIDTVPPTLAIQTTPANPSASTSASFTFDPGDSAAVTCQLDGNGAGPCLGNSASYSGLTEGTHGFTLRGTDAAGNTATQVYSWLVDLTAPTAHITSGPANPSTTRAATIGFMVSDGMPACSSDAGVHYGSCSNPWSFTATSDGAWTVAVKATDTAGNVGIADTYAWTIDTVAPVVTLNAVDYSGCPSTAYITFSKSDATTGLKSCTCAYTGVAAYTCTNDSQYVATIPASGYSTFSIQCTDNAGLTSPYKTTKVNIAACP